MTKGDVFRDGGLWSFWVIHITWAIFYHLGQPYHMGAVLILGQPNRKVIRG